MRCFLLFLFSFLLLNGFGQTPHFDLLTKDDGLPSNEVYDIAEDNDGRIYIATNEGFVVYVNGKFIPIPTENGEMPSGTGLNITDDNRIFCMSFDGRVFEIVDKKLKLFYDISDNLRSYTDLHLTKDNLILTNEKTIHFFSFKTNSWRLVETEKSLYFISFEGDKMLLSFENEVTIIYLKDNYKVENKINPSEYEIILYSNKSKIIQQNSPNQILTEHNGLRKINKFLSKQLNYNSIYDFTFHENNYLLGTRKGLFLLNKQMEVVSHSLREAEIGNILVDKSNQIWLTSTKKGLFVAKNPIFRISATKNKGKIDNITGTNNELILQYGRVIESIKNEQRHFQTVPKNHQIAHISTSQISLFDKNGIIKDINQEVIFNSLKLIKDISVIDSSTTLYVTRENVVIVANNDYKHNYKINISHQDENGKQLLELSSKRGLSTLYQKSNQNIWLGSVDELVCFTSKGTKDTIRFNNQAIKATDFVEIDSNEIWASTVDGICIIKNKKVIHHIPLKQKIFKLIKHNDIVYAISSSNIKAIDSKTHSELYQLSKKDGLPSSEIKNATIYRDSLFILTPKGLVQGSIYDLLARKINPPKLFLETAKLDNQTIDNFQTIDYGFSSLQFNFEVIAPNSENDFAIFYRLSSEEPFSELEKGSSFLQLNRLSEGKYDLEAKVIDAYGNESDILSIPMQIYPPFYRTNWFYLLIFLVVIGIISAIFVVRLNIIRKRLTLEKRLKASEITAIKSQMNPHFIFNALNSIQELILRKDVRSSNIYLGKFSELVRKVLSYSEKPEISLDEEIAMLTIYLELEKLRFKDDFHYEINSSVSFEGKFNLPSLLLQPYVENAIKHGLLHREGEKKLSIRFSENEHYFICEIVDNGIGRKKSAKIQERRAKYHQSFSSSANEKRIRLINEVSEKKINLHIEDLENDSGTKVCFQFEK